MIKSINEKQEPISKILGYVKEQGLNRRKSAAYAEYVSILRGLKTRLLGVRCIFEIGSNNFRADVLAF